MKFFIQILVFLAFNFEASAGTNLIPKVIYGNDDRMDVYQSSNSLLKELSRSTAVQIKRYNVSFDGLNYLLSNKTLAMEGVCTKERFSNQLAVGECSGFLIAPDLLVTAGHCALGMYTCDYNYWVFDYANINNEVKNFKFNSDQVFYCTQILAEVKDSVTMNDYAVIKLNRPVPNRNFLTMRKNGVINNNARLAVLGYPSGLPLKITSNATIRSNTNPIYFQINSDTFGGNSGSAVIDMNTGIVEGILVRGDTDYERREDKSCDVTVLRPEDGGRGEDVTRITNFRLP